MSGARLAALDLGDAPPRWGALGFAVVEDVVALGGISLRVGRPGHGITGWGLHGVAPRADIDGLATAVVEPAAPAPRRHPNGAVGLDHVVVVTPDFERTRAALEAAGLPLRRVDERPTRGTRQGFRRLGPAILELVESPRVPPGPARFWGLVVVVEDLAALAGRLGDRLGPVRPAVQPGRHIATLRPEAGLGAALAFMDPEPRD